jgi:hypothetical protein
MSDPKELVDHMTEEYSDNESDLIALSKAQSKTIVSQSKEITQLKKMKEQLEEEVKKLSTEVITVKATGGQQFSTSSSETICVVQLAMLEQLSMHRELTLEESKKVELFSKVLRDEKNKTAKTEEEPVRISDADLIKAMQSMGSDKEQ